jgi:presequence protease
MTQQDSFIQIATRKVASLNVKSTTFRHRETGALHVHLSSKHKENVFMVAFPTIPKNSSGVAHVLEHTALCGSRRYPVRDPFFMMIRRSLSSFMNAFTASDWTAYPFASQNKKDFFNLLDVYLDAAFFPNLDGLDFSQEGQRLELEDPSRLDSPLTYKGVVYNEMIGSMSSPTSRLWQSITTHLFPDTTYRFNSGGEPRDIPNLRHADLLAFHKEHYHPSNAMFFTFGDLDPKVIQAQIEDQVLKHFQATDVSHIRVNDQPRFIAPIAVEQAYHHEQEKAQTHIVLNWLLGHSFDVDAFLSQSLLADVLLADSSCPLYHALEQSPLAKSPSSLCGLDNNLRQMIFSCGVEGSDPEHADAIERLIMTTLETVKREGIAAEKLEAAIFQMEMAQREITGSSYPYGLQLILATLPAVIHQQEAHQLLDIDQPLQRLREAIKKPNFIKDLIDKCLLNNNHRLRIVLKPDAQYRNKENQLLQERLQQEALALKQRDRQALLRQQRALEKRQKRQDNPNVLPKLGMQDIPKTIEIAKGKTWSHPKLTLNFYPQATNHMVYHDMILPFPALTAKEQEIFPYCTMLWDELGCGKRSYREMQAWQNRVSGGISLESSVCHWVNDHNKTHSSLLIFGKSTREHYQDLQELLHTTFYDVRFDEYDYIRKQIAQNRLSFEQSINQSGHAFAMQASAGYCNDLAYWAMQSTGLIALQNMQKIENKIDQEDALEAFCHSLAALYQKLTQQGPKSHLCIGEKAWENSFQKNIDATWSKSRLDASGSVFAIKPQAIAQKQMWIANTQVHYCAKSYSTVPMSHSDLPALLVLAKVLSNGYLHTAVREKGGAYGGGAVTHLDSGIFSFYSYRDPRIEGTLADFDASLLWAKQGDWPKRMLDEAKLGIIANMDKPHSPAAEARHAFYQEMTGRSPDFRQQLRRKILAVSKEDVCKVVQQYFDPEKASTAVLTHSGTLKTLGDLGMQVYDLNAVNKSVKTKVKACKV